MADGEGSGGLGMAGGGLEHGGVAAADNEGGRRAYEILMYWGCGRVVLFKWPRVLQGAVNRRRGVHGVGVCGTRDGSWGAPGE